MKRQFNSVAEMFRTLMAEQGWTAYALAKISNVGESHLKQIVSGRVRSPGASTVDSVLKVLAPGMTLKYSVSLDTGDSDIKQ
jgi:transcriptional regulator with XRE-family HTH domain